MTTLKCSMWLPASQFIPLLLTAQRRRQLLLESIWFWAMVVTAGVLLVLVVRLQADPGWNPWPVVRSHTPASHFE